MSQAIAAGTVKPMADPPQRVRVRRVVQVDEFDPAGTGVRLLGKALAAAAVRLEDEMRTGEDAFENAAQRISAHRLISHAPHLIELLKTHPPPPDPNIRFIPPCPVCNAKAGEHWAHDCPKLDRFEGMEQTYDYRKGEPIFYKQIHPLAEPLKPNPYDHFTCIVCESRWQGIDAETLLQDGHDLQDPERRKLFNLWKQRSLR